jgi:signal transduction histidine kinase
MKSIPRVNRPLSSLSSLWIVFALILLTVAIGLGLLSRHALQLHSQQTAAQHRERLQQNVRVGLWRIDSRLAPYIATIHQKQFVDSSHPNNDQFIRQRFQITRENGMESAKMIYLPSAFQNGIGFDPVDRSSQIDALLLAVRELVPDRISTIPVKPTGKARKAVQSKSQQYSANAQLQQAPAQKGLQNRAAVVQQQVAINSIFDQAVGAAVREPQMLSVWIDDQLAIVRSRPDGGGELEGVWIDWNSLHRSLRSDIDDILPNATIRPAAQDQELDPEFALAALPAMIVPAAVTQANRSWSPTHTALLLSWAAFLVSAIIAAIALNRLIALSERRAAFVSAVTHELRTPLTTFRLYSDLLAREMISDPADRKSYLETLRREADRLTHLVENVLRYSRLERTSTAAELETVIVSEWIDRITPRLRSRLAEADLVLDVQQSGDGDWTTDPPAMEQVLFNLADNAAKYAVGPNDPRVHIRVDVGDREVVFLVTDHGGGVPQSLHDTMFEPFSKSAQRAAETAAGVGLGLALVKRTVTALGGQVSYRQSAGGGAEFCVRVSRC